MAYDPVFCFLQTQPKKLIRSLECQIHHLSTKNMIVVGTFTAFLHILLNTQVTVEIPERTAIFGDLTHLTEAEQHEKTAGCILNSAVLLFYMHLSVACEATPTAHFMFDVTQ